MEYNIEVDDDCKIEIHIDSQITIDNVKLKAIESTNGCADCYCIDNTLCILLRCQQSYRNDNTSVIFKEVK